VKAKTAALVTAGTLPQAEADALLEEAKAAILALQPAYGAIIEWAQASLPTAPGGKVGALTLPGGLEYYERELKLVTTTDMTAAEIHATGRAEVARIEAEQDALAQQAGFADRHAFYAERKKLYPPRQYDDAARKEYLDTANAFVARSHRAIDCT